MARKGISKPALAAAHHELEARFEAVYQDLVAAREKIGLLERQLASFRSLARQVRETQRLYFQTRSPQVLQEAKQLEKALDDELNDKPRPKQQPGLFDRRG